MHVNARILIGYAQAVFQFFIVLPLILIGGGFALGAWWMYRRMTRSKNR
ncbi:hypothetical protein [Rathayibacter soli]|nr:hypothetical protein [Glaciibacter superstes]